MFISSDILICFLDLLHICIGEGVFVKSIIVGINENPFLIIRSLSIIPALLCLDKMNLTCIHEVSLGCKVYDFEHKIYPIVSLGLL